MISRGVSIFLVLSAILSVVSAFAPILPAAVEVNVVAPQPMATTATSSLQQGVGNFVSGPAIESSTLSLSLKERPPPPTKEEIAAKKRNFNLLFWGGGFVAPFISTVYYFGPKFWKK